MVSLSSSYTFTASDDSARLPVSMREMSRTSLMSPSRCRPPFRICCTHSSCPGSRPSIFRTWLNPRMALSGVRSSWLMREELTLRAVGPLGLLLGSLGFLGGSVMVQ
jgi:hypothetical protein